MRSEAQSLQRPGLSLLRVTRDVRSQQHLIDETCAAAELLTLTAVVASRPIPQRTAVILGVLGIYLGWAILAWYSFTCVFHLCTRVHISRMYPCSHAACRGMVTRTDRASCSAQGGD